MTVEKMRKDAIDFFKRSIRDVTDEQVKQITIDRKNKGLSVLGGMSKQEQI